MKWMLSRSVLDMRPSLFSWARCGPALSPIAGEPAAAGQAGGRKRSKGRGKDRERAESAERGRGPVSEEPAAEPGRRPQGERTALCRKAMAA